MMCFICVGVWNAARARRHKFGRILVKALQAYLGAGGKFSDIERFKVTTIHHEIAAIGSGGAKAVGAAQRRRWKRWREARTACSASQEWA